MGGKGSGRNVWKESDKHMELRSRCVTQGWNILDNYLRRTNVTPEDKLTKIIPILAKTVPQELKSEIVGGETRIILIRSANAGLTDRFPEQLPHLPSVSTNGAENV